MQRGIILSSPTKFGAVYHGLRAVAAADQDFNDK